MAAALITVGSVLVSVGTGIMYRPAGLIVAGVLALWFGIDATRDVLPERPESREHTDPSVRGGYRGGAPRGRGIRRPRSSGMRVVGDDS